MMERGNSGGPIAIATPSRSRSSREPRAERNDAFSDVGACTTVGLSLGDGSDGEWEAGKAIVPKPSAEGSATGSSGSVGEVAASKPLSAPLGKPGRSAGWNDGSDDDWGEDDDWTPGPSVPTPPVPSRAAARTGTQNAAGARRMTGFGGGGPTRAQRLKTLVKACVALTLAVVVAVYLLNVGAAFKRAEADVDAVVDVEVAAPVTHPHTGVSHAPRTHAPDVDVDADADVDESAGDTSDVGGADGDEARFEAEAFSRAAAEEAAKASREERDEAEEMMAAAAVEAARGKGKASKASVGGSIPVVSEENSSEDEAARGEEVDARIEDTGDASDASDTAHVESAGDADDLDAPRAKAAETMEEEEEEEEEEGRGRIRRSASKNTKTSAVGTRAVDPDRDARDPKVDPDPDAGDPKVDTDALVSGLGAAASAGWAEEETDPEQPPAKAKPAAKEGDAAGAKAKSATSPPSAGGLAALSTLRAASDKVQAAAKGRDGRRADAGIRTEDEATEPNEPAAEDSLADAEERTTTPKTPTRGGKNTENKTPAPAASRANEDVASTPSEASRPKKKTMSEREEAEAEVGAAAAEAAMEAAAKMEAGLSEPKSRYNAGFADANADAAAVSTSTSDVDARAEDVDAEITPDVTADVDAEKRKRPGGKNAAATPKLHRKLGPGAAQSGAAKTETSGSAPADDGAEGVVGQGEEGAAQRTTRVTAARSEASTDDEDGADVSVAASASAAADAPATRATSETGADAVVEEHHAEIIDVTEAPGVDVSDEVSDEVAAASEASQPPIKKTPPAKKAAAKSDPDDFDARRVSKVPSRPKTATLEEPEEPTEPTPARKRKPKEKEKSGNLTASSEGAGETTAAPVDESDEEVGKPVKETKVADAKSAFFSAKDGATEEADAAAVADAEANEEDGPDATAGAGDVSTDVASDVASGGNRSEASPDRRKLDEAAAISERAAVAPTSSEDADDGHVAAVGHAAAKAAPAPTPEETPEESAAEALAEAPRAAEASSVTEVGGSNLASAVDSDLRGEFNGDGAM